MKSLKGRTASIVISIAFLATLVLLGWVFDIPLFLKIRSLSSTTFETDCTASELRVADLEELNAYPPHRLARFLSYPSAKVRAHVCFAARPSSPYRRLGVVEWGSSRLVEFLPLDREAGARRRHRSTFEAAFGASVGGRARVHICRRAAWRRGAALEPLCSTVGDHCAHLPRATRPRHCDIWPLTRHRRPNGTGRDVAAAREHRTDFRCCCESGAGPRARRPPQCSRRFFG